MVDKKSVGSTLMRQRTDPQGIGITKQERNNILAAIQSYGSEDFGTDSVDTAISFTWTIIQRAEEEWRLLNETQEAIDTALKNLGRKEKPDTEEDDTMSARGKARKKLEPEEDVSGSFRELSRLRDKVVQHSKNFALLGKFSLLLKELGTLVEKRESINEKRLHQEYMRITQHSAILDAYVKCMLIAMMEAKVSDVQRLEVVKRFQTIYKEYPIITEDLQSIHDRLFGTPVEVTNVKWEKLPAIIPPTPSELKDMVSHELGRTRR